MNDKYRFIATDLGLAQQHAAGRVNAIVDCSDDIDPELIGLGVEEEEEEEETDPDEEPDEEEEEDRGDEVDPSLPPEEDEDPDAEEEEDSDDEPDDLDPDALAELAGEGKAKSVPHARFNEVNQNLKNERAERLRLEEEVARLRGAAPAPVEKKDDLKPFDFDAAEDRYMDAVLDGDKDKAKAIRAEIRSEERKALEQEGAKAGKQTVAEELRQRDEQAELARLQQVAREAVVKHPFFDAGAKDANPEAIEELVAWRDHYIRKGLPPSKALATAVEKVAPRYAKDAERKPTANKPSATEEQILKNMDRAKRIPQAPAGVGERGKDIDYSKLSEDEFDALPAEEKKKARGDYVKEG